MDERSPVSPAPKRQRYLPEGYDTRKWPSDPTQGHKNRPAGRLGYVFAVFYISFGVVVLGAEMMALLSGRLYAFGWRTQGHWSALSLEDPWWWVFWLFYLIGGMAFLIGGVRHFRKVWRSRD